MFIGGDEGDRTPDLMNAIHALSQLSYVPETVGSRQQAVASACAERLLSIFRFQLSTVSLAFENGLTLFEKRRDTFLLIFSRKTKCEEVYLTAKAFIEIRA